MTFWRRIKALFSGPDEPVARAPIGAVVEAAVMLLIERGATFSSANVATHVGASVDGADVAAWVERFHRAGTLAARGYTRTLVRAGDRMVWLYHPSDRPPVKTPAVSSASGSTVGTPTSSTAAASATTGPPARVSPPRPAAPSSASTGYRTSPGEPARVDLFAGGDLTGLSPAELRARATAIDPYRTAWIGRVDVIPPATDERTALIDRGLELRGLLSREQLEEIHRIGDLWLEHKGTAQTAALQKMRRADDAVAELRKREAEAKAAKKQAAADRAAARAVAIAERRAHDVIFLGRGVGERLHDRRADVERLAARGLPVLASPADVAQALGIAVPRLRWLAFHAEASARLHYVQFEVPKRTGGVRVLASPLPAMRAAQHWIRENVLEKLALHPAAHGFVAGRSTVTNARAHQGRDIVVNLDLVDFFGTLTFPRVRGFFVSIGYSPAVATVLALLCTEAPRRRVEYAGTPYWVAVGPRSLPQGACTSPALSNHLARRLDARLTGLCTRRYEGFAYTRYADDLTFSAPAGHRATLGAFLSSVRHVVRDEGFAINEAKGRVQRRGGRQTVTGIVVNDRERLRLPREEMKRLRAILHNAAKTGLAAQNREGHPDFAAHLRGRIAYVAMIDSTKGAELERRFAAVR